MKIFIRMYLLIVINFVSGCDEGTKKITSIEMLYSKGMSGKPAYIHFVSPDEGYSFNNIVISSEQTQNQLDDPNFLPKSDEYGQVYKTTDGGRNWQKVYAIRGFSFYSNATVVDQSIFIQIIDNKLNLTNKLLKINLKNSEVIISDYVFERMGNVWAFNNKVLVNSKSGGENLIYTMDLSFKKIDSMPILPVFKGKVFVEGNEFLAVTWKDEIYSSKDRKTNKLAVIKPETILKINNGHVLVAGASKANVVIGSYNVKTKETRVIKDFRGYTIIQGMQSNNEIICGFIGNIKGLFIEYDLFYSLDSGKTWQIHELIEKNYVRPCSLTDSVLYIYSGDGRIQKIVM